LSNLRMRLFMMSSCAVKEQNSHDFTRQNDIRFHR
jgi:hypothetical protein